jgi:hypothetical protein
VTNLPGIVVSATVAFREANGSSPEVFSGVRFAKAFGEVVSGQRQKKENFQEMFRACRRCWEVCILRHSQIAFLARAF